jgi:hypothetical protein
MSLADEIVRQCTLCLNCHHSNDDRPSIFRGEPYCSVNCAKALGLKG